MCACVLMNHPFPANLPLLRKIYAGRFSTVRFLIPFERMPDEDVITVYRGSYNHAAYLTDAHLQLSGIECDYYLVIHDDVLLNPVVSEDTFLQTFGLGADDGFIPAVQASPQAIDQSIWWFGMVPKMLFPKSILFGTGVEPDTLTKYLPPRDALEANMTASGATYRSETYLYPPAITKTMFGHPPSRLLLHGLAAPLRDSAAAQKTIEEHSLAAELALVQAMLITKKGETDGPEMVDLPLPIVNAGYYTDIYIVPKSGFDDYCHYIGVASAANLFVEMIAPTLLYACCSRVRTAAGETLDFSGFDEPKTLDWFADPKHVALHPFKLSSYRRPEQADLLLELLDTIRAGEPIPADAVARAGFGSPLSGALGLGPGWHAVETWGVWSSDLEATIPVLMPEPGPVLLRLLIPKQPYGPPASCRLIYNGGEVLPIDVHGTRVDITVVIPRLVAEADGVARIRVVAEKLVQPSAGEPGNLDSRMLGIAFMGLGIGPPEMPITEGGGWHEQEDWGAWSAAEQATVVVALQEPASLRLMLVAPPIDGVARTSFTGRIALDDGRSQAFEASYSERTIAVELADVVPGENGLAYIRLVNDVLIVPNDFNPAFHDGRRLGIGFVSVETMAEHVPAP